jgi:hypothetical protein
LTVAIETAMAEIAQNDDLRGARVDRGEAVEGGVDRGNLLPGRVRRGDLMDLLVERHRHDTAAAPAGVPAARVLGEDPPHHEGGDREEVDAVGELRAALASELEEGLVDEGGRL